MAEGKIRRLVSDRGFGFIKPEKNGEEVFFHSSVLKGTRFEDLQEGIAVVYESERGPKGPRATVVRLAGGTQGKEDYRFLNPYNFVRSLQILDPQTEPLLGNCEPPPHDRYVGLTGKLKCQVTVQTPLFISDSHAIKVKTVRERGKEKEHPSYRFFEYDGEPALPASSLRGMLRSMFEAATNSCFSVFTGHRRLSYHLPPHEALKLVPARVIRDNGKWYLDILNGTTPVVVGSKPSKTQYAAWVMQYTPLWRSRTCDRAPRDDDYCKRTLVSLGGLNHKDECQAVIEEIEHPIRHFKFWNVVKITPMKSAPLKPAPGQQMVTGYLCITNQNIENKHDERFFFCNTGSPVRIPLLDKVRRRYKELILDYQERHADDVHKRRRRREKTPSVPPPDQPDGKTPAFSRFILNQQDAELEHGDLVYAMLSRTGRTGHVDFIVPVSVPRVGYDQTIRDRLDQVAFEDSDLYKCQQYDELCPACRMFGWVYGTGDPEEPTLDVDQRAAYAGRIRLTHGTKREITGTFDTTLAILSSPKPTTTRFYLRPSDGSPRDGLDDRQVDYGKTAGQQLRGRKFYRHQGNQISEQEYASPDRKQSDQNRTVKGVVKPQSTFEFELEFENLAQVELGALLWSLELDGWHHRLGLGKPLGFGSVTIKVEKMELLDPVQRYKSFGEGWDDDKLDQKDGYVAAFKEAMIGRYGDDGDFYKLDNIRDLKALLAESPDLPIHYPRSTERPQPEGKNYEWFVGNKRKGGLRIALRLATEDTIGLPLVDKFGK